MEDDVGRQAMLVRQPLAQRTERVEQYAALRFEAGCAIVGAGRPCGACARAGARR